MLQKVFFSPLPCPQLKSHLSDVICSQEGQAQSPVLWACPGGPPVPETISWAPAIVLGTTKVITATANLISALRLSHHSQKNKLSDLRLSCTSSEIGEGPLKQGRATWDLHTNVYALVLLFPMKFAVKSFLKNSSFTQECCRIVSLTLSCYFFFPLLAPRRGLDSYDSNPTTTGYVISDKLFKLRVSGFLTDKWWQYSIRSFSGLNEITWTKLLGYSRLSLNASLLSLFSCPLKNLITLQETCGPWAEHHSATFLLCGVEQVFKPSWFGGYYEIQMRL